MHRKLIHSFCALGLVLSLATAAFIAAVPAPGAPVAVSARGVASPPATTVSTQATPGSAKAAYSRHRRAQAREAMALPFFSFAQGLRSGNRS